jgi:hypothetical protein
MEPDERGLHRYGTTKIGKKKSQNVCNNCWIYQGSKLYPVSLYCKRAKHQANA